MSYQIEFKITKNFLEGNNFNTINTLFMIKSFLNEYFHHSLFLCVRKSFSTGSVVLLHYKSRFCSSCCINQCCKLLDTSLKLHIWTKLYFESFFHEKKTSNMKLKFEFDKSIRREMIGQQSFSNNFSINFNDSVCLTLQVKWLRKSYIYIWLVMWFVFHDSSWSFHEAYFSRKHISRIV